MDSETKPALFRTLAVVVSVAVVFLSVEIISSIALSSVTRDPEVPQELRASLRLKDRKTKTVPDPYLTYRVAPNIAWDHIRTNRYGLRNDPIEARPGADTFRILFLGGSVAWGSTSRSNDQTPAAFLERYLTERRDQVPALRGKRIEVLNGGVPAYVAWQSVLSYSIRHRALEPRVVISLDGANEVSAAIRTQYAGAPMRFDLTRKSYRREKPRLFAGIGKWLAYRFERLKLVRFLRESRPPGLDAYDPPPPRELARAYRRALEHLSDITRAEGAIALPVLQPMVVLPDAKPLTPFEMEITRHEDKQMPGRNAYYQACFAEFQKMFEELRAERADLRLLDASQVFVSETGVIFTDPAHLTQLGRQLLIQAIGARLIDALNGRR